MSVATCKHCGETIMTPPLETYYVHTRTGMAQCGIRYATPVNPTADETKDLSDWTEFDLQELADGLNGIEPISAISESESDGEVDKTCNHLWLNKAGTGYRSNPVEVCAKCGEER